MKCHLDFETRSTSDLKRVGTYRYAEDPNTAIWLFAYRFGDGVVNEWRPGWPAPDALLQHIAGGGIVVAHNAAFERNIWNTVLRRCVGAESWPRLTIAQMSCTMARALAIHLPADLETLGQVLGLKQKKDAEGHKLMMKMSKPRKKKKLELQEFGPFGVVPLWHDDPKDIDRLGLYCQQDVIAESEADERLPPLSDDERRLWDLDQKINDRGIAIDVPTIEKIVEVLAVAQSRANAKMQELTNGAVNKVTEATKLTTWLQSKGFSIDSIAKSERENILAQIDPGSDEEEAISLRFEAAKNSTAKYKRLLESRCDDNRVRGILQYHRASTGRWGGALVQPQNLPRVDEKTELPDVLGAIGILA